MPIFARRKGARFPWKTRFYTSFFRRFSRAKRQSFFRFFRFMISQKPDFVPGVPNLFWGLTESRFCGILSEHSGRVYAGIAQSVEQLIRNQQVACSSHVSSSKNDKSFQDLSFLLFTLHYSLHPTSPAAPLSHIPRVLCPYRPGRAWKNDRCCRSPRCRRSGRWRHSRFPAWTWPSPPGGD